MTIRFPNGVSLRYHNAKYLIRDAGSWALYTKNPNDGGAWVASIQLSAGCVVECEGQSVTISNPVEGKTNEEKINGLLDNLRGIKDWRGLEGLKELKKALAKFDSRTNCWRE